MPRVLLPFLRLLQGYHIPAFGMLNRPRHCASLEICETARRVSNHLGDVRRCWKPISPPLHRKSTPAPRYLYIFTSCLTSVHTLRAGKPKNHENMNTFSTTQHPLGLNSGTLSSVYTDLHLYFWDQHDPLPASEGCSSKLRGEDGA